jgi:hypothetical protein
VISVVTDFRGNIGRFSNESYLAVKLLRRA